MRESVATAVWFGVVFGAGFVLGTLRVFLVEPWAGARCAQLVEMPVMVGIAFLLARRLHRRTQGLSARARLRVGVFAMSFLLAFERLVGFATRGDRPFDPVLGSDPWVGAGFLVALGVVAGLPWWVARREASTPEQLAQLSRKCPADKG